MMERTCAWLGKARGLCRDYEVLPENHEGIVYVVMIHLILRRLTDNRRRYSSSTGTAIGITFLLLNLEQGLRAIWALFLSFLTGWNNCMEVVRAIPKDIYRLVADFMSIDAYRRLSYVD
ncbi:MAG: hypothetical protein AAGG02_03575 [Cyanobacteria bacterium P01_H01_bin.15]